MEPDAVLDVLVTAHTRTGRPPTPVVDGRKPCCRCGEWKDLEDFHRDRQQTSGRAASCKECRRPGNAAAVKRWRERHPERRNEVQRRWYHNKGWARDLKIRYGVSPEQYVEMLETQDGVCAICGNGNNERRLTVDHDHATDQVRGLLCGPCNSAIGMLREDPSLFAAAVKYLESGGPHG